MIQCLVHTCSSTHQNDNKILKTKSADSTPAVFKWRNSMAKPKLKNALLLWNLRILFLSPFYIIGRLPLSFFYFRLYIINNLMGQATHLRTYIYIYMLLSFSSTNIFAFTCLNQLTFSYLSPTISQRKV